MRNKGLGSPISSELATGTALWQNGSMMDLNSLVVGGAPLYLIFACQIDDAGEIVGWGATETGDIHAFEAIPLRGPASRDDVWTAEQRPAPPKTLSQDARRALQRRDPLARSSH